MRESYRQTYWSDFATLEHIQLVVRFDRTAVQHLLESPLSKDQIVTDISEDEVRLSATVPLTERLVWWLMGFGANVVVEKPDELRKNLASRLHDAAQKYQ